MVSAEIRRIYPFFPKGTAQGIPNNGPGASSFFTALHRAGKQGPTGSIWIAGGIVAIAAVGVGVVIGGGVCLATAVVANAIYNDMVGNGNDTLAEDVFWDAGFAILGEIANTGAKVAVTEEEKRIYSWASTAIEWGPIAKDFYETAGIYYNYWRDHRLNYGRDHGLMPPLQLMPY